MGGVTTQCACQISPSAVSPPTAQDVQCGANTSNTW